MGPPSRCGPPCGPVPATSRHAPVVRRILLDAALLVIPASALWALLPLVAARRLGLDAGGYGLLLAALGLGALIGAVALPRVRARLSDARMLLLAFCVFSAVLVVIATVRVTVVVALASPQAWHGSRCSPPRTQPCSSSSRPGSGPGVSPSTRSSFWAAWRSHLPPGASLPSRPACRLRSGSPRTAGSERPPPVAAAGSRAPGPQSRRLLAGATPGAGAGPRRRTGAGVGDL